MGSGAGSQKPGLPEGPPTVVLLWQWGSDGEVLKVLAVIWEKNSRHKGPPYLFILTVGRETEAHQEKEEATQVIQEGGSSLLLKWTSTGFSPSTPAILHPSLFS